MNLHDRTEALLALVEATRARRREEILGPARAQARSTLRAARAEARLRVATAVAEARHRIDAQLGAARAALQTERRQAQQQQAMRRLGWAGVALRAALLDRWRQPSARSRWVEALLARARAALPATGWRIEYAADWNEAERAAAAAALAAEGLRDVVFAPVPELVAGLRIRAGHNLLDGSLEGLLADRAAVEGRLLRALAEAATPAPGGGGPQPVCAGRPA